MPESLLPLLPLALPLVLAFALGALLTWLLLRPGARALQLALTQNEADRTTLEAALLAGQHALAEANDERSRLAERAAQIPGLETRLAQLELRLREQEVAIGDLREQNGRLGAALNAGTAQTNKLQQEHAQLTAQLTARQDELAQLGATHAANQQALADERRQHDEKMALLEQAKEVLSDRFKTIATELLDEKSRKFTEQNQSNLDQILLPLRQQITDFKSKVEEVYVNESKDRSALAQQVKELQALNTTLHQDAQNLTLALKGDRKAQGNWGEIILDEVLERAGLREGEHYTRQNAMKAEDGASNVIPDVIIRLPGERQIVVDSKFTLPDYRAFADAADDDARAASLKRHLTAIRNHIKGLSEKKYQALYELQTLDFVVMFIPLEPAFMLAVTNDAELFSDAWEKNVLLVSPSTLLFVVRTIAHLWRQDALSRNAKEISRKGADLYEKLVGFVDDLERVGGALGTAQRSFDEAKKKLRDGRGSAIRQAEMLVELGVKPAKTLHVQWGSTDERPALPEP